jgi:hypothetical protein
MLEPDLIADYALAVRGLPWRTERFACILPHRRARKTVACIK